MQQINANEDIRLIEEAEAIANAPILEAGNTAESESLLSDSTAASFGGSLVAAPVTSAFALAR